MSRPKRFPVYVASATGTDGCGHQHKTGQSAYNCGGRKLHVVKVTTKRHGKEIEVIRKVLI